MSLKEEDKVMSTFGDTLEQIDYHNHREQLKETWGHLAPIKNKTYNGRIVYAVGCFGNDGLNPTTISYHFDGLESSPWFHEALTEFIGGGKPKAHGYDGYSYMIGGLRNVPGCVYEWTGTLKNYRFKGQRKLLLNSNPPK